MTQPFETTDVRTDQTINDLVKRVADLEARMQDHTGDAQGSSGQFYQHPIASFDTAEFGGGIIRLWFPGMQVLSANLNPIQWVSGFGNPPPSPFGQVAGGATLVKGFVQLLAGQTGASNLGSEADITVTADDTTPGSETSTVQMTTLPKSGASGGILLQMVNGGTQRVLISGGNGTTGPVVLQLTGQNIDPTFALVDGMIWYRSDLGAFRFRAGGVTSSLTLP